MAPFFDSLKRMYDQLSHGVSFDASELIRQRQLLVATKAWARGEKQVYDFDPATVTHGDLHGWVERLIVTVEMNYPTEMVEAIRNQRDRIHEGIRRHFELIANSEKAEFAEWLRREAAGVPRAMLLAYSQWLERNREVDDGTRPFSLDDVLRTPAVDRIDLIGRVLQENGVPEAEAAEKTAEFLNSDTFAAMPFHRIACSLWAVLSIKGNTGQKEPPNRGTVNDISIVSTLMPYCDAMLIDNKCVAMVEDIPQRHALGYSTRLFSTRTGEQFIEYLQGLERDADPTILAEVERVYGPTWLTPFLSMYEVERERQQRRAAKERPA